MLNQFQRTAYGEFILWFSVTAPFSRNAGKLRSADYLLSVWHMVGAGIGGCRQGQP
jgi:hypothetical protein